MGVPTAVVMTGSALFLVGAAVAVPAVFLQPDPDERLRLLEAGRTRWLLGQPLYALGALIAAVGVCLLGGSLAGAGALVVGCAGAALLVGAGFWSVSVAARARAVEAFARGELPGWPFRAYVWLTLVGLALLAAGQSLAGLPAWTAWLTLGGAVASLVAFLRTGDLPPFVFYLLLPAASFGWP